MARPRLPSRGDHVGPFLPPLSRAVSCTEQQILALDEVTVGIYT